jgi:hypothetical protein
MSKQLSQKDLLLQNILKSDKKKHTKVVNNSIGKTNTKGNIDVKAKNRKSQ